MAHRTIPQIPDDVLVKIYEQPLPSNVYDGFHFSAPPLEFEIIHMPTVLGKLEKAQGAQALIIKERYKKDFGSCEIVVKVSQFHVSDSEYTQTTMFYDGSSHFEWVVPLDDSRPKKLVLIPRTDKKQKT
jgi:hypothetical protein